jgi:hypothetical protein
MNHCWRRGTLKPVTVVANRDVQRTFAAYPLKIRLRLLELRELIFEVARSTFGVGRIEETLKWGEPAYLTAESKSGSTIRLGWKEANPCQFAMYFHCQTNLIETFRHMFPAQLRFEGNRAIVFEEGELIPYDLLAECIRLAFTYHVSKRSADGS